MEKWFGITFARTLFKEQGRDLWRTEMHVESCCLPAAAFGTRFGMSRNRYDAILSCLRFGIFSDLELLHNPWLPVQCFIDAFNTNGTKVASPGTFILLDEIMSSWLGLEADYSLNGIPHKTKIKRKPKGVGVALKALIDCKSSIMMRLELCEGALRQCSKLYEQEDGSGTAVTLRMSAPWHGKAHIVIADSAFSSVATAVALKQHGTYFIGIVKTAHKMYPKQFMGTHDFSKRGDHVALSANVQGHQLFAVGWLDGKRKDLVSTCGTTLPSTPATCTRQEVVVSADKGVSTRPYLRTTPRCNIVASYFDNFHFIDVHDHMRQGILKLEQHWLTRNWVYRVLSTLFGVIVTDCYYASGYIHPAEMSGVDFREYVDRLAYQLINSDVYGVRTSAYSNEQESVHARNGQAIHTLKPLYTLPAYGEKKRKCAESTSICNYRARRRCIVCSKKAAFFCATCYERTGGAIMVICSSSTGRDCLIHHISSLY